MLHVSSAISYIPHILQRITHCIKLLAKKNFSYFSGLISHWNFNLEKSYIIILISKGIRNINYVCSFVRKFVKQVQTKTMKLSGLQNTITLFSKHFFLYKTKQTSRLETKLDFEEIIIQFPCTDKLEFYILLLRT